MNKFSLLGLISILILLFMSACNSQAHTPTFFKGWSVDETYHWHMPECGHINEIFKEEHKFSEIEEAFDAVDSVEYNKLIDVENRRWNNSFQYLEQQKDTYLNYMANHLAWLSANLE